MHVKLKLLACLLSIIMIFGTVTCSAEESSPVYDLTIEKLVMDERTGKVTVNGKVNSDIETVVTMIVYYPDASGNAVDPGALTTIDKTTVFTIDEMKADENGSFAFTFTIKEDRTPGDYLIRLGVKGMQFASSARGGTVKLLGSAEKNTIKSIFNGASVHTDLKAFFENHGGMFILPDFYDSTYDIAEEDFNNILIDYRDAYYTDGVPLLTDIQKVIDTSEIIYGLKTLTRGEFEGFLGNNKTRLNIDLENKEYKDNKTGVQDKLFALINTDTERLVESWGKLSSEFEKTVILEAFSNTDRSQTDYLLRKYSIEGIDVNGDYTKVDPVEMGKAFEDKTFTLLSEIKDTFIARLSVLLNLLEDDTDDEYDPPTGGGGGGGGHRVYNIEGMENVEGVKEEVSSEFTDIASVAWASEAITALKNRGIIAGMTPTQFCPANAVTREQFVKMAVMAFGSQWSEGEDSFADVDSSAWYTQYIKKAVNAGVVNGQGGFFGVGQSITRQDVAVILYRIMENKISSAKTPLFKDYDKIASYAQDAVCAMYSVNILSGDDKGLFNPTNACTRAEAAKLIYNVLSVARSKDNEVILCIVENVGIIGEITGLENDGQMISSCVINDNIYDLTKEFAQEIKTNSEQKRNFVLGRSLRFAITHDGKIAYSFESEGGEQYGYLLNAAFGTKAIKPDEGEFLIYSQNGELIQLKGAKKIETNSGSGKNAKETISQWDAVNNIGITNNGEVVQQLIKYELNDKGELNKLYYATKAGDAAAFDYESERFYKTDITSAPNVYRSSTSSIGEYTVSDNTIIFMIEKRDSDGKVESDGIRITPLNFTDSQAYSFSAYDYSAYKAPKAVVLDSSDSTDKNGVSDDAFILQKKIKVITDGEEHDKIIGLMNGVSKEYVLSENFTVFDINGGTTMTLNDLEEGDAFLVAADMSGKLTKCVQVCDISNDKKPEYKAIRFPKSSTGTYGNSACTSVVGNVADYTFNAIGVRTKDLKDNTDKITGHSIVKKSYFYLYDSSEPKGSRIKAVTADELVAETAAGNGSRVVVASRYTAIRTVIIIK